MLTPYEELEFLADYIPDEGEAIVVMRQDGELRCEPVQQDDFRAGIDDAELYGRLVQANERLNAQGSVPLWTAAFVLMLTGIVLYRWLGLGWGEWYLLPAVGLLALFACFHWIRSRQSQLFDAEVRPMLIRESMVRQVSIYGLIAGIRQHAEFRTLLDELVRWEPARDRESRGL
ncbi:MAG: hypothetical protein KDA75_19220 [Planctomycetaceae bacterium]|nr:hypothetical protein [Planctomycetaceae bacterium]